ncbi:hypothetical protein CSC81_14880 [Tenacibaculum discolor]|uniref:Uncharacterized protein n=1 Tax=Tenacibaculum discolor TaxID=361581 RepID=A0A2G1BQK9_9FLAO|nr:hypothetical protein [Tenacibaculum discolor]MDP2541046.1 hypothetical protein [Tenacibaculum discolor]PHN96336.1 hypothetical protein CSC81_14880 [Tenacibaculum discolor]PHN99924.1 hypothetical protein CSC82_31505 [Rhodobacteraceae bacterium 4F10]
MKKEVIILILISLLTISNNYSQHKYPLIKKPIVELLKYGIVDNNAFGDDKMVCSKYINSTDEERYKVFFVAKFKNFLQRKTFDFNDISLVDTDRKIRYRPKNAGIYNKDWSTSEIKLSEYEWKDTFLENSLEGIENFDFFIYHFYGKRKKPKYRYRLKPANFKRKKGVRLFFSFPALKQTETPTNFKIYWKKELIGKFRL